MKKYSRREFLRTTTCSLGALLAGYTPSLATDKRRPNILILLTDDHRWDTLGCAGNPVIQTKSMDRLALDGVRFSRAFATSPICAASRTSILTGLHERGHKHTFGTRPLNKKFVRRSYPYLLRREGYRTGFVGKFGLDAGKGGTREMFDVINHLDLPPYYIEVAGRKRHLTQLTTDYAVNFLKSSTLQQPFCLSVSFNAPHAVDGDPNQFYWPEDSNNLYRETRFRAPGSLADTIFRSQPDFIRSSLGRTRWHQRFDTPEKYQEMVRGYYRMITGVDMEIGRLVGELKKSGFFNNTVIIMASDNGYFLGERGLAGKWLLHEPSIRIPLIIFDPRLPRSLRGRVLEDLALNIDIAPTVLSLAGIDSQEYMHGRSLVHLMAGKSNTWRNEAFLEHLYNHPAIPRSEGLRTHRWKYIRYMEHPDYEELYDLQQDSDEARNLSKEKASRNRLIAMRELCNQKIAKYSV